MYKKLYSVLLLFFCLSATAQNPLFSNSDFELTAPGTYSTSNAVSGWTVQSTTNAIPGVICGATLSWTPGSPEFSVMSTPVFGNPTLTPFSIDNISIGNSPLGGSHVVRLQNSAPSGLATSLKTTFAVTGPNPVFEFAYAGSWDGSGHLCCDQPCFQVNLYDCSGVLSTCASLSLTPPGNFCIGSITNYSVTGNITWTNWQIHSIDLSPYIGSCVMIEIITSDCTDGFHHGTAYFDAYCGQNSTGAIVPSDPGVIVCPGKMVNFCPGSIQAQIYAPPGYSSYQWYAGNPPQPVIGFGQGGNTPVLTIVNPVAGSVYTVQVTSAGSCTFAFTDTLQYSSVCINALGSTPSCVGGASGSATVQGNGSGTGYTYNWYGPGSPNSIGYASTVSNLAPGVYTVNVNGYGASGCGTGVATVTINTIPYLFSALAQPFCDTTAYLSSPSAGSNFQWYRDSIPIPANQGGSASGYTVNSASNGDIYYLTYTPSQGCKDSIEFYLFPTPPGGLAVTYNKLVCPGDTNGQIIVQMTPASQAPTGLNYFLTFATGSSTAFANAGLTSTTFILNHLSANLTYSVNAFDGLCAYTSTLAVNAPSVFNDNFSISSATVCEGSSVGGGFIFNSQPPVTPYSFSWTPTTFLYNNLGNVPSTLITPTAAWNSSSTIVYTAVIIASPLNCTESHTFSISVLNFPTPTITSTPSLCLNAPAYTITVNPPGGIFINGPLSAAIGSLTGVLTPSLAGTGPHTFSYCMMPGTCAPFVYSSYFIDSLPVLSVSGNLDICKGDSAVITASGADSYTWNPGPTSASNTISSNAPGAYSINGLDSITGCVNTKTIYITALPLPTLSVKGNTLICQGESSTFTISGADAYAWDLKSSGPLVVVSPKNTTYFIVKGRDIKNCYDTDTVTVIVSVCTALPELNADNPLKIFPNPTNGDLFIEANGPVNITLYNELGAIMLEGYSEGGTFKVDLTPFKDGLYFIKAVGKEGQSVMKVVKQE